MRRSLQTAAVVLALALAMIGARPPGPAEAKSFSRLFDRVKSAVVVIRTLEHRRSRDNFTDVIVQQGLGSGVVVSKDGLIMTAAHVVQVADEVTVQLRDGRKLAAKVVGSSMGADVALVKLEHPPDELAVARLGDSDRAAIGDEVMIVGAPYGIAHTLTLGHLSGRRQAQGLTGRDVPVEFLQTDAAVNQGNSGGPMFNTEGEVIGIVSHILTQSGGSEGIGFAVAINTARKILLEKGTYWTGVEFFLAAGPFARALNIPQEAGLLVQRVADHSPGARLGLRPGTIPITIGPQEMVIGGDVILEIMGTPISMDLAAMGEIQDKLSALPPGGVIEMKVLRAGEVVTLTTTREDDGPRNVPEQKTP